MAVEKFTVPLDALRAEFEALILARNAAEQEVERLRAALVESEAHAGEGWDWLSMALDTLGVQDVFAMQALHEQRKGEGG